MPLPSAAPAKKLPQQVRGMKQDVVPWLSGQRQSIILRRGMVMRDIILQLQATCAKATALTIAGMPQGDAWNLVDHIELVQNGSEVLWSLTGEELMLYNQLQFATDPTPIQTLFADTLSITANSTVILPLWTPRAIRPLDTALDTSILSALRLDVYWRGSYTDMHPLATSFTANPSISVWTNESFFPDGVKPVFTGKRISRLSKVIAGAGPNQRIDIPLGAMVHSIMGITKNSAGTADAAPPTAVRIKSGPMVFADFNPMVETNAYLTRLNCPSASPFGSSSNLSIGQSCWIWDSAKDGFLTECPDTIGLSEFYVEMDFAGACNVELITTLLYPVRG